MREILYLAHRIPYPPNKGDKLRVYHELKFLREHFKVHLGAFVDDPADWQHREALSELCDETHFVRLDKRVATLRSATGLLTGQALTLPYYASRSMRDWVDRILATRPIQAAMFYSGAMAQFLMRARHVTRVAGLQDIDSDKWRQYAETARWPMSWVYRREAAALGRFEAEVTREFDATFVVTTNEVKLLEALAPDACDRIHVVASGVDTDYFSPDGAHASPFQQDELALVFTGAMDYLPNIDAAEWFADEILSHVRRVFPSAMFYVVGARPAPRLDRLRALDGVVVTGTVPDVRPYLAHATLALAPLRLARGVQNKVLEAMAMRKPVVVTDTAARGITAQEGRDFAVAGTASSFADTVIALLGDSHRRAELAQAARECVLNRYSWQANLAPLVRMLEAPPSGRAESSRPSLEPA